MTYHRGRQIVVTVARFYGVTANDLRGPRRFKSIVRPRMVACFLLRERTAASYPEIGHLLGGKDHSTVIYACRRIAKWIETDEQAREEIDAVRRALDDAGLTVPQPPMLPPPPVETPANTKPEPRTLTGSDAVEWAFGKRYSG